MRSARFAPAAVQRGSDRSDRPSALGSTVTPLARFRTALGAPGASRSFGSGDGTARAYGTATGPAL